MLYAEYGDERFQTFRKTHGYANAPLDGVWLRAPYLHNGSVPDMAALLSPPEERPRAFLRGYDVYDPRALGFVSDPARIDPGLHGRLFCYVTSAGAAADCPAGAPPMNGTCDGGPCLGNGNGGHRYGTALPADGEAGADRASEDLLRGTRDGHAAMAAPGPWYKVARVVAVLLILGVIGGVYAWWKFFREVPQEVCGDVEPSRRAELCASPEEERFKYGSLGAEWELGIPYPIFHVLPRVFGDLLAGAGRLSRVRHPVGGGQGAAGRLLEEDRGVPADHPDLRDLPCGELPDEPGRRAGDRAERAVAHHERHGVPRLPRGGGERSALVGGRDAAGDDAVLRPRDRRQAASTAT